MTTTADTTPTVFVATVFDAGDFATIGVGVFASKTAAIAWTRSTLTDIATEDETREEMIACASDAEALDVFANSWDGENVDVLIAEADVVEGITVA